MFGIRSVKLINFQFTAHRESTALLPTWKVYMVNLRLRQSAKTERENNDLVSIDKPYWIGGRVNENMRWEWSNGDTWEYSKLLTSKIEQNTCLFFIYPYWDVDSCTMIFPFICKQNYLFVKIHISSYTINYQCSKFGLFR